MSARKAAVRAAAVTALVLGAIGWSLVRAQAPSSEEARGGGAKAKAGQLGFAYMADTTYAYDLRYASKTKAIPLVGVSGVNAEGDVGRPIEGELALGGELAIHAFRAEGEGMILGFSLARCTGTFRVAGQDAWPEGGCQGAMNGKELLVHVDTRGEVQGVFTPEGGASLFDYTMRAIVEETQVRLTSVVGLPSWVEAEPLPQGTVGSVYRLLDGPAEGGDAKLERTRSRYLTLSAASMLEPAAVTQQEDGRHRIVVAGGVIEEIEGKEKLRAETEGKAFLDASTEMALKLKGKRAEVRPLVDLARLTKRGLADVPQSRSLHDRMLEQRAAGLSWEEALATLTEHGEAGSLPDHNRFLWRTTALLELVPSRAEDLAELFETGAPGGRRRGLVLDLLASAGTPEAQRVLQRLLASERAKSDPRYVHLVQRMGFVEEPTKESIAFVKSVYADATKGKKTNERFASAYALGSISDHARAADPKAAQEIVDELTRDLGQARPEELVFFLNALANADSASAVGTFEGYATNADPEVREAVAGALDEPQTPRALAVLLDLAADPSREVQRAALHSLRRHTLTAPVLVRLTRIAEQRRFAPSNVRFVVDLVKTYRFVYPREEEALLRALLAGEVDDVLVRAAAQQLLDAR